MKQKYKNIEFTLQYYKYDDVRTMAYMVVIDRRPGGNHSYYNIPLNEEQKHNIWMLAVTKGKEEARAEVKRIFRQLIREEHVYKQYPFKLENGDIISIKGEYVKANAPLKNRYLSAQRQKQAMESDKWIYTEPIKTGTLQAIDGKLKIVEDTDNEKYTEKILKDSQFCKTIYTTTFWDEIRKQRESANNKKQKRIEFLKDSIKTYNEILKNENRIPKTSYPFKHITGCENWKEDYQRTLNSYISELKNLTA